MNLGPRRNIALLDLIRDLVRAQPRKGCRISIPITLPVDNGRIVGS